MPLHLSLLMSTSVLTFSVASTCLKVSEGLSAALGYLADGFANSPRPLKVGAGKLALFSPCFGGSILFGGELVDSAREPECGLGHTDP